MTLGKQKRNAGTAWLEKTNPLAGMSIREAQAIFDSARAGDTQRLHWMFAEIESANSVLMTCVERRVSALSGFRASVTARPWADPKLADEQKDAVSRFLDGIENFSDALEHLDLAFFRGFSYIQPIWELDGTVRHIELPDSWLFLAKDGQLFYNPVCDGMSRNAEPVTPAARLVGVKRRRPIDYPALSIHIRQAVGNRDWGRFLERIALPKPAVIMAPSATDKEKDKYVEAAERVEDGQVSVWPSGSSLTDFMGGSRGQDPFSAFIRHQEEKVVLLSTGGTLTSLAQADTGSLAGGAQMDVWKEIVRKDAAVVAQAVNRMVREYLERAFPAREAAAEFTFETGAKLSAQEAANVAATLKGAGWLVKQDELEEAVGFTLEKAPETPQPGPFGGLPITNKAATPFKTPEKPFKTAPRNPDGQGDENKADAPEGVLGGSQGGDRAERIFAEIAKTILDGSMPYEEALKKAQAKLDEIDPSLLSADLEAELEKAMFEAAAKAASDSAAADGRRGLKAAPPENGRAARPAQPPVENAITNPCPKCHRQMSADGTCSFCAKRAANHSAGKSAFEEVSKTHKDKVGAMERDSIGKIDFIWGDDTEGICHILGKHKTSAQQIPGVLAYGDVYESKTENKFYIIKKRYVAVLRKRTGSNHYLITGFKAESPDYAAKIRKECRLVEDGE